VMRGVVASGFLGDHPWFSTEKASKMEKKGEVRNGRSEIRNWGWCKVICCAQPLRESQARRTRDGWL